MKKLADWVVTACLRGNGRVTLTKISKITNIPISTLYDKLRTNNGGIIKRHTCLLDYEKLGFNTRAHISLKIGKEDKLAAKDYLAKHQNINSLLKINNGYDFLVDVVFRHMKELEDFLDDLKARFKVDECHVYYIIDEIKQESFLSNPEHVNLVM